MLENAIVSISKRFSFDSAHFLPAVKKGHKCGKLHGHTYTLEVEFKGPLDPEYGWLIDYGDIKKVVKPLVDQLDHQNLNDLGEFEYTTAEELAIWFWKKIKAELSCIYRVSISETPNTSCDYFGEKV